MKRKPLITGLFAVLILVLTACAGVAEPEPGEWNGNVFTSEHLGLRFVMPEGWFIANEAEIEEITGMGVTILEDTLDVDLSSIDMFYDFLVASQVSGAIVQISHERSRRGRMPNPEQHLDNMIELFTDLGGRATRETGTTRIGGYDWHSFRAEVTNTQGMTTYSRHFFTIHGRFLRTISINTSLDTWILDNVTSMFTGLEGSLPEPINAQFNREITGTWGWDQDDSIIWEFNADRTGYRNVVVGGQVFEWYIDGNEHLIIMAPTGIELWTYSISGNRLTIDNRVEADLVLTYIRQ